MEKKDEKKSQYYFLFFYWNPKDKRLFVPKRLGFGWTVNFAHPLAIPLLLGILIVTIVAIRLL